MGFISQAHASSLVVDEHSGHIQPLREYWSLVKPVLGREKRAGSTPHLQRLLYLLPAYIYTFFPI